MSLTVDIHKQLGRFSLDASFRADGGTLGLLGASGSGKSLTLKCIAGIERPDRGKILLNGVTLFDSERWINLPPQKRRVGYLFQNYALFPNMTVRQNILCGIRWERDRARRAAELHMPERTGSRIFVIGRQAGSGKNFARNSDDFIGAPVMQDAIAHGKHAVASGGINAGIQAAAAVSERRKHLAAIMAGIFHADDGQRVGEKLPHGGLFAPEVFAIGDGKLDAAAAAALGQRAFHKGNLL